MNSAIARLPLISLVLGTSLFACASSRETMQAIQYTDYGPSSVLHLASLPRPQPQAGEVLVKIGAAGVNSIDWENRQAAIPGFAPALPVVPGYDLAGEIVELGSGVADHRIGEKVFAMLPLNAPQAYAEYARVPAAVLATQPKNVDAVHAAAVPLVALTAWQALFEAGQLKSGQTVLIHGAAGGVGHLAVQLAKHAGARVIGTSSQANLDFVRRLGADDVIDYKAQKFEDVVKDVDLVFDTVGGDTPKRSLQVVRKGGALVSIAGAIDRAEAGRREIRARNVLVRPDAAQLKQIAALIEEGALKVEVDTVYPLREAALAQDKSEGRHVHGKLVLQIGGGASTAKH